LDVARGAKNDLTKRKKEKNRPKGRKKKKKKKKKINRGETKRAILLWEKSKTGGAMGLNVSGTRNEGFQRQKIGAVGGGLKF